MNPFEFLIDDWKKIPQNLRYFLLAGAYLVFNTWLLDHWGTGKVYLLWGVDIRDFGYSLGTSFVIAGFLFILAKQALYFKNVLWLRWKYPVKSLNESFYLIWFNGKLILFDNKTKKYHHIYPFETAQDLLFVGLGKFIKKNLEECELVEITDIHAIDVRKFKQGHAINTRG